MVLFCREYHHDIKSSGFLWVCESKAQLPHIRNQITCANYLKLFVLKLPWETFRNVTKQASTWDKPACGIWKQDANAFSPSKVRRYQILGILSLLQTNRKDRWLHSKQMSAVCFYPSSQSIQKTNGAARPEMQLATIASTQINSTW